MLASRADVAAALGLEDEDALSESQQARVDTLLERVSGVVAREANRAFTPGDAEARFIVVDGRICVSDAASVTSVADAGGEAVDAAADVPGWFTVSRNGCPLTTGEPVVASFVRGPVPPGVTGLVAGVVSRLLMVDPVSPESRATELTAGPFRVRNADWVSSTSMLTEDERAEARSYRNVLPNVIVHRA